MRRTLPTAIATVSTSPTRLHQPLTLTQLSRKRRQTNLSTHRRATRTLGPLSRSVRCATSRTGATDLVTHRYLRALLWNRTTVMLLHDFADRYSTPRYVGQLHMVSQAICNPGSYHAATRRTSKEQLCSRRGEDWKERKETFIE